MGECTVVHSLGFAEVNVACLLVVCSRTLLALEGRAADVALHGEPGGVGEVFLALQDLAQFQRLREDVVGLLPRAILSPVEIIVDDSRISVATD